MNKFRWLASLSILATSSAMALAPVIPTKQTVTLVDGTLLEVQFRGSAYLNWHEDAAGNALVERNGQWHYAEFEQIDGQMALRATSTLVTSSSLPPEQAKLRPSPQLFAEQQHSHARNAFPKRAGFVGQYQQRLAAMASNEQTIQPVLVVEVDFTTAAGKHDFQADIFGTEQRSVVDFFDKNSFGKYKVVPVEESQGTANDGVISLSLGMRHPDCNPKDGGVCNNAHYQVFAQAYEQLEQYVDFSQYDTNGDNYLHPTELSVLWVFAGGDLSTGGRFGPSTWPHQGYHPSYLVDGQTIEAYCVVADTQANAKTTIGVIVHELGHLMLSLPDLYSYVDRSSIGSWGVMSVGSWGMQPGDSYPGETPVNMSAFSKHAAGFVEPEILDNLSHSVELANGEVGLVYLDPYLKEFGPKVYLENRVFEGYDLALEGEGMLATSVNVRNKFNFSGPMQVQIMQADNQNDLASSWTDDGDVYPGRRFNQEISDTSAPSLRSVTGFDTDVALTKINVSDQGASFLASIPESDNKTAEQTSLSRYNAYYFNDVNTAVFEVNIEREAELQGLYAYFSGSSSSYRLYKLPRAESAFGPLVVNINEAELLSEGVFPRPGRTMIEPVTLPAGTYNLMLQFLGRAAEVNFKWGNWGGDPQGVRTWLGDSAVLGSTGLNPALESEIVPFAALIEYATNKIVEAYPDSVSTEQETAVTLSPRANDFVAPGYQFEIEVVTQPSNGVLNGLEYTPNQSFVGSDYIEYRLIETNGQLVSNTARIYIQVLPSETNNQPPVADVVIEGAESSEIVAGKRVSLNGQGSRDPEAQALQYQWTQIAGDTVVLTSPNAAVTEFVLPSGSKMGDEFVFTLMVVDNFGASATESVTVTVANSAPIVVSETEQVLLGETTLINVLDNERDQDGHALTLSLLGEVSIGVATVVDNQIQYQAPAEQADGTQVVIRYQVTDEIGASNIGTLTVVLKEEIGEPANPNSGGSSSGGSLGWLTLLMLAGLVSRRVRR